MLLPIERGGKKRARGVDMSASVDDTIPSTTRDTHKHRIEGGVEVYFVSFNTALVLDIEESSVGC